MTRFHAAIVPAALVCLVPSGPAAQQTAARGAPARLADDRSNGLTVTMRVRAWQPGEVIVAAIAAAQPATAVRVQAFDRDAPVFPTGDRRWSALIGIDLDAAPGRYTVAVDAGLPSGPATYRQSFAVAGKAFRTRTLTVDQAFVTPPETARARIAEEAQLLAALWPRTAPERFWTGPFARPVPHEANSAFGTRSVFNGEPRNPHTGADFMSPAGTPVLAPNRGRVVLARDLYYSGGTVILDHGLGLFSTFAHLSQQDVSEGALVESGTRLGLVGATGRVTGPHLHWAVRLGATRVDPLSLLHATAPGPDRGQTPPSGSVTQIWP